MAEKKNYWTQAIGTQDALVQFGGIGLEKDVTSSFKVVALDGSAGCLENIHQRKAFHTGQYR